MKRLLLAVLVLAATAWPQVSGDQLGAHDLSPSGHAAVRGPVANACLYCHAPHGGMTSPTPLWNQQLSIQTYTMYGSTTYHQTSLQPAVGSPSKLCLSCHDGTVAPGQTVAYGQLRMTGAVNPSKIVGTDLSSSHPFSLKTPLADVPDLNASLVSSPPHTGDPAVRLVNNTIECTSCHDAHFQAIDKVVQKFLVRDNTNSTLCLACHDPSRVVGGQPNRLAGWSASVHATASNAVANSPYVGGYPTVAQNGCQSCHMPHNAFGPARLLRGADQAACATCHSGGNLQPAAPNVFAELAKVGHPVPGANALHDAAEPVVLNNNRHATCADCHNAHAGMPTTAFAPAPGIRPSQNQVGGISAVDGLTPVTPYAVNQYENCFRCHGSSTGKSTDPKYGYLPNRIVNWSDPLNVVSQLAGSNRSSHPVTHDRSSALPQSSLRANMLQLDGVTPGRAMGARILCTDCHNSDDNREFGGTGANGPHGSQWKHILERRYEMAQASKPGGYLTQIYMYPDPGVTGPYALCGKCHDLNVIFNDTTNFEHNLHVFQRGTPCSACHSAHGSNNSNPLVSGDRLVNFDTNVVAPYGGQLSYTESSKTCTLTCHGHNHYQASTLKIRPVVK